jgi:hypothetical protein
MDDAGPAAHGAILNVLLARSRRWINRDHDLLAAGITDVGGIVVHRVDSIETTARIEWAVIQR